MSIVQRTNPARELDIRTLADAFEFHPSPDDARWWDEQTRDYLDPAELAADRWTVADPYPWMTDRQRIVGAIGGYRDTHERGADCTGDRVFLGDWALLCADALEAVVKAMDFFRIDDARVLVNTPGTHYRDLDIDDVAMPGLDEFECPLAREIVSSAKVYTRIEPSTAGDRLMAVVLSRLAYKVESFGVDTADDFYDAEAAWKEACLAAMGCGAYMP